MADSPRKGYRRSWKNLLINKGYQLRFTLFMVGLSALLMIVLGLWVMREADKATTMGINNVLGRECPQVPAFVTTATRPAPVAAASEGMDEPGQVLPAEALPADPSGTQPAATDTAGAPAEAMPAASDGAADSVAAHRVDEAAAAKTGTTVAKASGIDEAALAAGRRVPGSRSQVTVEVGNLQLGPEQPASVPPEFVKAVIDRYQCRLDQVAKIHELKDGYARILAVLVAVGLMLTMGLALYGIKMTHRVAGPLHKVSLYLDKVRDGRYDKVYDLRKGDYLVQFYDSFKAAHAGLRTMEENDIELLRHILQVAEGERLADRSPEIAALLDEMRTTLGRKEKSLE